MKQHMCRSVIGAHTARRAEVALIITCRSRTEDTARTPTIVMDHYFLKPNSTVNSETVSDESVTCIAVKEDRHQNIMSSVVIEERSRRALGKRESDKVYQCIGIQRNHIQQ